jgi:putative transposase
MPDHVHAIVWFPVVEQLSHFMKQWKQRSSVQIKRVLHNDLAGYAAKVGPAEAFWQRKYYVFHLHSEEKMREKLRYMHANPVRAGLVRRPCDWPWSSARYYEERRSVGVPVHWVQ